MAFINQHRLATNVFILSGRWDHTADYRSQIALAATYPQHVLFIADDNHTFNELKKEERYSRLIRAFFNAVSVEQMRKVVKSDFFEYLWKE